MSPVIIKPSFPGQIKLISMFPYIELLYQYQINYAIKHHRVHYQGHILNLITQAFLQRRASDKEIKGNTLDRDRIKA